MPLEPKNLMTKSQRLAAFSPPHHCACRKPMAANRCPDFRNRAAPAACSIDRPWARTRTARPRAVNSGTKRSCTGSTRNSGSHDPAAEPLDWSEEHRGRCASGDRHRGLICRHGSGAKAARSGRLVEIHRALKGGRGLAGSSRRWCAAGLPGRQGGNNPGHVALRSPWIRRPVLSKV